MTPAVGGESTLSSSPDACFASSHLSLWLGADAIISCLLDILVPAAAGMASRSWACLFHPATSIASCQRDYLVSYDPGAEVVNILSHHSAEREPAALPRLLDLEPLGWLQLLLLWETSSLWEETYETVALGGLFIWESLLIVWLSP